MGARSCCRTPCPALPLRHHRICVAINSATKVVFAVGCPVPSDETTCEYNWTEIDTQNSWGKRCRVVVFDRKLQANQSVRIRFCSRNDCGDCADVVLGCTGSRVHNALLSYTVDGIDFTQYLQKLLDLTIADQVPLSCVCSKVGCISPGSLCCIDNQFTSLSNIPPGAEIILANIPTSVLLPDIPCPLLA